jgi:hypothetical protein
VVCAMHCWPGYVGKCFVPCALPMVVPLIAVSTAGMLGSVCSDRTWWDVVVLHTANAVLSVGCTVQCSAVQYSTLQYSTVHDSTILGCSTVFSWQGPSLPQGGLGLLGDLRFAMAVEFVS